MRPMGDHATGAPGALRAPFPLAYVGERLDAAGFRLAGVLALAPPPGGESAALAEAMLAAPAVLLSAEVAARLPPALLDEALRSLTPLVAIVPDARCPPSPHDPVERVRQVLGLADPAEAPR